MPFLNLRIIITQTNTSSQLQDRIRDGKLVLLNRQVFHNLDAGFQHHSFKDYSGNVFSTSKFNNAKSVIQLQKTIKDEFVLPSIYTSLLACPAACFRFVIFNRITTAKKTKKNMSVNPWIIVLLLNAITNLKLLLNQQFNCFFHLFIDKEDETKNASCK